MDNKKKIIITIIAAMVFIVVLLMMFSIGSNNTDIDKGSVQVRLPDATVKEMPRAKIKAYEQGNKAVNNDRYLSHLVNDTTPSNTKVKEAISDHKAATESLANKLSSGSRSMDVPSSENVSTNTNKGASKRDNWKERYDYLYEKIYGDLQHQQPQTEILHQPEQKPETIHVQANQEDKSDDGFITITVGNSEQPKDGILKVATTSEQKIKAGDKVQLRLVADAILQDNQIARNTYIYAIAKIEDNRLQLTVSNINIPQGTIPCNLVAYDTDGYKGLSFNTDDSSQEINREVKSALQTTVGQLAAITNRTAGNIIRSTSRIGSNAIGNNKQQTITLPANYMIQLR